MTRQRDRQAHKQAGQSAGQPERRTLRCAIYTRVSSDAGLEQDFNSLHAQREAAEAYIRSQAHEGWRLVRDRFDDGGYSGGSTDRPALQKLLTRIQEQRIDVVVVYKVDRLTRSLADFAKLVELFDAHGVSFVSVTQSFNTTSSMGRLTLNVLLSFAQFEREVTGERIRDKIAASKKKGLWMGGIVPFGYRVEDRKLVVEEAEAAIVRQIFALYRELGSIPAVQRALRAKGHRTRVRVLATGRTIGGIAFTNGPISHILRNRLYIGEINHKGQSWPGAHAPIIDAEVFAHVQARLAARRQRRSEHVLSSGALLMGRIFTDAGERMSPNYAVRNNVRHHYYVARSVIQGSPNSASQVRRIPAGPVETLVLQAIRQACTSPSKASASLMDQMLVEHYLTRVTVHPDRLVLTLQPDADSEEAPRTCTITWTRPSAVRKRDILLPTAPAKPLRPIRVEEQARLLKAIALARQWVAQLMDGTIPDLATLAARENRTERSIRMTLALAFLDPQIITAACEGTLPRGYGISRLVNLPPDFDDQWRALGLNKPERTEPLRIE